MKNLPYIIGVIILITGCKKSDDPKKSDATEASFTIQQECPQDRVIVFTNLSKNATSYEWNFGDGSKKSTELNTSHYYSMPGSYTVTLTANGKNLSTISKNVTIVYPHTTFYIEKIIILSYDFIAGNLDYELHIYSNSGNWSLPKFTLDKTKLPYSIEVKQSYYAKENGLRLMAYSYKNDIEQDFWVEGYPWVMEDACHENEYNCKANILPPFNTYIDFDNNQKMDIRIEGYWK